MTGDNGVRQGLKERAATWIINRVAGIANSRVNIAELQRQYNANEGRVSEMRLTDIGRCWYFRVKDGKLQLLSKPDRVDGGFEMTVATLVAMARGKQKRMNPATGEEFIIDFSPMDCVTQGLVRIYGDAASNDLLLFAKAVLRDVYPQLRDEFATKGENGL